MEVAISGITSVSSPVGKTRGDVMPQDDTVTPRCEEVKSCSMLEKNLPSAHEMKTLPQVNDTGCYIIPNIRSLINVSFVFNNV